MWRFSSACVYQTPPLVALFTWGFPEQIWPVLQHRQVIRWILLNARISQKCKIRLFSSKKYSIYVSYYAVLKEIKCNMQD